MSKLAEFDAEQVASMVEAQGSAYVEVRIGRAQEVVHAQIHCLCPNVSPHTECIEVSVAWAWTGATHGKTDPPIERDGPGRTADGPGTREPDIFSPPSKFGLGSHQSAYLLGHFPETSEKCLFFDISRKLPKSARFFTFLVQKVLAFILKKNQTLKKIKLKKKSN